MQRDKTITILLKIKQSYIRLNYIITSQCIYRLNLIEVAGGRRQDF